MELEEYVIRAICEVTHEQIVSKYEEYMGQKVIYNANLKPLTLFDRVLLTVTIENFRHLSNLKIEKFYDYWGYDFQNVPLNYSFFASLKDVCTKIYNYIQTKEVFDLATTQVICYLSFVSPYGQ